LPGSRSRRRARPLGSYPSRLRYRPALARREPTRPPHRGFRSLPAAALRPKTPFSGCAPKDAWSELPADTPRGAPRFHVFRSSTPTTTPKGGAGAAAMIRSFLKVTGTLVHLPRASSTSDTVRHDWLPSSRVPSRAFRLPIQPLSGRRIDQRAPGRTYRREPRLLAAPFRASTRVADVTLVTSPSISRLRFVSTPPTPSSAPGQTIPSRERPLGLGTAQCGPCMPNRWAPRLRVSTWRCDRTLSDRAGRTFEANTPLGSQRAWPSIRATLAGRRAPRSVGGSFSSKDAFRAL